MRSHDGNYTDIDIGKVSIISGPQKRIEPPRERSN